MTTLYFVRHAEPNYDNHDDLMRELSPKGMTDRLCVTEFFADISIDRIISSPYKRAYDTISDLAQHRNLSIEIVNDFRERRVSDGWIEDFQAFAEKQWSNFSYKFSDGECLQEVQDRNIAALHELLHTYPNQTVVIGSHGTALSTIIHHYDPTFGYADFERIRHLMPWIVRFRFNADQCESITAFDPLQN